MTERPTHATVYEVAARAGVSTATVSRVVNAADGIRPATREKVLRAIAELGYVPNGSAQGLGRRSTGVIGLVYRRRGLDSDMAPGEADPHRRDVIEQGRESLIFYDQLIRSVEQAAYRHGYVVLLTGARSDDETASVMTISGKVDGMILMDRVIPDENIEMLTRRVPVACIAHYIDDSSVTNVMVDNRDSMRNLVDHLVDEHHVGRIAMLAGPRNNVDSAARVAAVVGRSQERGVALAPIEQWQGNYSPGVAYDVVRRNCSGGAELPDVIMCANDGSAAGAIAALRELGLSVPLDVAITGFDDMEIARLTAPALTTVRQPLDDMALVAVRALAQAATGGRRSQSDQTVPGKLIIRRSCGCAARHRQSHWAANAERPDPTPATRQELETVP